MSGPRFSLIHDFRVGPGQLPTPASFDRVVELIVEAERLGYFTAWTTEQHGVDDGYLPTHLPVLSALARETETIRLGAGVILLPLTQFRRVAEEAGVVDVISGGRLTLGLGAGHHPHEFRAFGVELSDRARLMDEGLAYLREALRPGAIAPDGLPINIPPVQDPLPIVVGAAVKAGVDRAARLADGHFSYAYVDAEESLAAQWRNRIEPAMAAHGRERGEFQLIFSTFVWASPDFEREWQEHVGPAFLYQQRKYSEWAGEQAPPAGVLAEAPRLAELRHSMLVGPPAEIAERLAALRAVYPFDEIVIWPQLPGVPHELARRALACFAEEVMPRLAEAPGGPVAGKEEG
ncbi:MAG TPA: LLM class flavin-dependent oxidoreductase [Solirubrobacterales bacterium]|nr:LLM class flavin-dependent oxidoreductase [Solirubrobacterales bacterium]